MVLSIIVCSGLWGQLTMVCNNSIKYCVTLCVMLVVGLVLLSWSHAIYVEEVSGSGRMDEPMIVRILDCLGVMLILCSILGYAVKPFICRSRRKRMKNQFCKVGASERNDEGKRNSSR